MARTMLSSAPSPCTWAGDRMILAGYEPKMRSTSLKAAPSGEVTMPIRSGNLGRGLLRSRLKRPSAESLALRVSSSRVPLAQAGIKPYATGYELHPSLWGIDPDIPEDQDILAVLQLEAQPLAMGPEQNARELGISVLEGEVPVAGPVVGYIGYLSPRPEVVQAEVRLQPVPDPLSQLADGKDACQFEHKIAGSIFNLFLRKEKVNADSRPAHLGGFRREEA